MLRVLRCTTVGQSIKVDDDDDDGTDNDADPIISRRRFALSSCAWLSRKEESRDDPSPPSAPSAVSFVVWGLSRTPPKILLMRVSERSTQYFGALYRFWACYM
jgi:hypothetical protein